MRPPPGTQGFAAARAALPREEDGMAVYTDVPDDDLRAFVGDYDIGEVISCKGIAEGVENSNFLLRTDAGIFFLTLYEKRVDPADLPFFIALMEHLAKNGIACPLPVKAKDGVALRRLCGRPAAIITFLDGMWPRRIHPFHCSAVGEALARLHLAGASFAMRRPNNLSLVGWKHYVEACGARADEVRPELGAELAAEIAALDACWPTALPEGVIHADLFPDNILFRGERVTGIIDFYFACTDFLAYDLAICLNAWCFESDGSFNVTKARALIASYRAVRPLSAAEFEALPLLARGSALRFLLTRLYDWLHHPPGAFVRPKDPIEYLQKLRFHRGIAHPRAYGVDA
jgi:homoserine kinase type II